jgi:hypothetical protein
MFDLFPQPTGLGHRSQITEGPVLRALLLYMGAKQVGYRAQFMQIFNRLLMFLATK